jgi:Tol biopolymer transport system component
MRGHGLVVASGLVAGALAGASIATAAFPGRNGRLAVSYGFTCHEEPEIATLKADGSGLRQLVDNCADAAYTRADWPEWSPDGERLLFQGTDRLMLVAADGSTPRAVPLAARPPLWGDKPSFAPTGRTFAYTRFRIRADDRLDVWVYRASMDGRKDRRLRAGSMPRWSPDGRTIAYVAPPVQRGGDLYEGGTWLMNARSGSRIRRLSPHDAAVLDWASDGRSLVFGPWYGWDLSILRRDGTTMRRLTNTRGDWRSMPSGRPMVAASPLRVNAG